MIKKAVIAGLLITLMIQELRHIAAKQKLPKMLISEVDAMLYDYNMSPASRVAFKSVLVKKGIMEEKYTELENLFPNQIYGRGNLSSHRKYV